MTELVLPGVFIEVRDEGLLVPTGITVGTLGVVGTARRGPVGQPVVLGSPAEARRTFGESDPFIDGASDELTLTRALELAFEHGARSAFAVRVASAAVASATYTVTSAGGANVVLTALTPGSWGNDLEINVAPAENDAFVENETHPGGAAVQLRHSGVVASARNRVTLFRDADGTTRSLAILYAPAPAPGPNQVRVEAAGTLTFAAAPAAADVVTASYAVRRADAVRVTLRLGTATEVYTVVSGEDLAADLAASAWVRGAADAANGDELPTVFAVPGQFAAFGTGANTPGDDGAIGADYQEGLDLLLEEPVHIVVAAGQDAGFGPRLAAHCELASTDELQRERIAVVGSRLGATFDELRGHSLASDRLIFVAPGLRAVDRAASPPRMVTLPAAYTAAVVAGRLAGLSPHISPTNKTLAVDGLETVFTRPQLRELVTARILVLEARDGVRVVRGLTTSTNTAFQQVTTRRIVDFAKLGVRASARPFIGRLNNERVRGALRTSLNAFLAQMVEDEMLVSYTLEVSATRDQEIRGIVAVEMTLLPTFSIDFIRVTMFLG